MINEARTELREELLGAVIMKRVKPRRVIRGVHEHLMKSGAVGGDVHGSLMVYGEAVLAGEGGIEVGHHSHFPRA